jgi:cob(I)alamin adenosyltransferase
MAEKSDNEKTEKEKRKGYRLTRITTKFGDKGKTYIVGGFVLSKHHPRVRAYGSADELASFIGYTLSKISKDEELKDIADILKKIQNHLFILEGDLARLSKPSDTEKKRVSSKMIDWLEELEEKYLAELEPLEDFILPGGSEPSSLMHILRTVARRCEREIVELMSFESVNENCLIYMNRLSDLFFILARIINKRKGIKDEIVNWEE